MPVDVPVVEPLATADDLNRAASLYREVFGYHDVSHSVNPRLLRSLQANGGSVVGARGPDGELAAFAYGFVGVGAGEVYHYSQAAVVHPRFQGRGLGRALKRGQREIALAGGQSHMRWSYDPVLVRNAHFNLDVLGAVGRWFQPDFFGIPGTDRMIVEWDLDDERRSREAVASADPPEPDNLDDPVGWLRPRARGRDAWLPLPVDLDAAASRLDRPPGELRRDLGSAVGELIDAGYLVISCVRVSPQSAVYRFVRMAS